MNSVLLNENIGGIDIYLLDQILKERFGYGEKIFDAGCGKGRNLKWFYQNKFEVYGVDANIESIEYCKNLYATEHQNFKHASLEKIPFDSVSFNHVICNAVLHFAENFDEFIHMFEELLRVLKPNGILFIRMASNFGMENEVVSVGNGNYLLPDGSNRFLLTTSILNKIKSTYKLSFIEDVKTTIVEGKRCMTTLVIKKI